ncbi:hypothetical protein TNCV_4833221, partial [Trichonephila clavipes]
TTQLVGRNETTQLGSRRRNNSTRQHEGETTQQEKTTRLSSRNETTQLSPVGTKQLQLRQ